MPQQSLLRSRSLLSFFSCQILESLAGQMIAVAVGWQVYALTRSAFFLGLVGLTQFAPMLFMTLFAGYAADHWNRKAIICFCQGALALCFLALAVPSLLHAENVAFLFAAVFCIGALGALNGPALTSILPGLVGEKDFPRAAAVYASMWQTATIVGPALGGLLYTLSPAVVYFAAGGAAVLSALAMAAARVPARPPASAPAQTRGGLRELTAGIRYIGSRPAILGAISLDLFAVLFGGATALLPIYAANILRIGSLGLGVLRSAPAAGAVAVSFLLAKTPITRRVGMRMFAAVIVFGLATIVFAVSRSFWLSLAALVVLGAADSVSVVVRSTLVQVQTPDAMRGRVNSVNQIFIGTSNQLGEFESGLTAAWFGAVGAALAGGVGTILVVLLWMLLFPALRRMDAFDQNAG